MQVQIDGELLKEALSIISKMSPPESGNITIQTTKDHMLIHSAGQLNTCSLRIPSKPTAQVDFAVPLESLKAAISGHSKIETEYKNTMWNLKSGRSRTSLSTFDSVQGEVQDIKYDSVLKLKAEQVERLRSALSEIQIKPNTFVSPFVPLAVVINEKSTFLCCFDATRMSYTTVKEVTGNTSFVVPFDILYLITSSFNKTGLTMKVSSSTIECSNALVTVRLAIPEIGSELPSIKEVKERASSLKDVTGTKFDIDKEVIAKFLQNSRSVITKERPEIKFKTENGNLYFSVETSNGVSKSSIKFKNNLQFNIDGEYFEDLVKRCKDSVQFILVDQSFVKCKSGSSTLVMALNQD